MVKLDVSFLRHLAKEDFRVLVAIEMGHKNHDLVPTRLINTIANLKFGGCFKAIGSLHKHKLIYHVGTTYDGYRLTYFGYDYLVLKTLTKRGTLSGLGNQIGTGKESDIYIAINDDQKQMAIKFQRLGRLSFKTIKRNRDYLGHRKSASWLYLSRLAAIKEYSYMKALHDAGFPVPTPIDYNRHAVLMELIPGTLLNNVSELANVRYVYKEIMGILVKFAEHGLIHGDFNEFNIMIGDDEKVTVIDFPQMVSIDHQNAEMYFDRDVNCIRTFFEKRFGYVAKRWPQLKVDIERKHSLDREVAASGFTKEMQKEFEELVHEQNKEEEENGEKQEEEKSQEEELQAPLEEPTEGPSETPLQPGELDQYLFSESDDEGLEKNENKATLGLKVHVPAPAKEKEKEKEKKEESESESFSDSEEEGEKAGKGGVTSEVKKRMQIQKRVKKQIAQKERKKKVIKNTYKQRDKRAIAIETKACADDY